MDGLDRYLNMTSEECADLIAQLFVRINPSMLTAADRNWEGLQDTIDTCVQKGYIETYPNQQYKITQLGLRYLCNKIN